MSNYIELYEKWASYNDTLNASGLDRLVPFNCKPEIKEEKNYLEISYSIAEEAEDIIEQNLQIKSDKYDWLIIPSKDIYLRFRDVIVSGPGAYEWPLVHDRYELPVIFFDEISLPYYMQVFLKYIKTKYKRTAVKIIDSLPFYFSIKVTTNFNLKNREVCETTLWDIANYIVRDADSRTSVENIIVAPKKTFSEKVDELLSLSKGINRSEFSNCLACGKAIKYKRLFCNAEEKGLVNRDNCRNKFNYWLDARLGIKDAETKAKKRNQLHNELQGLISEHPYTAFEKFNKAHNNIYKT